MSIYTAADRGGNSAWKGFSSQTTYIASRLITEQNKTLNYYPESIEDLKITNEEGQIIELVQVKNLSSDLYLSNLKPQSNEGFLRRSLNTKRDNPQLRVRLVSYGDMGVELKKWKINSSLQNDNITNKLTSYGYDPTDILWLRRNIVIEEQNESELRKKTFDILSKNIETSISPQIAYDVLINYISRLSRHKKATSKALWDEKVRTLSLSLASRSGWKNQFGKTILPLKEYQNFDDDNIEKHRKEYENGISAIPQHIYNEFDIERDYWLNAIEKSFTENNITIIHGAAGQGKSSLAYRYLFNNFAPSEAFIVSGIDNKKQTIDIAASLREIDKQNFNMIVHIDIEPLDNNWVWLLEQIHKLNLKFNVLVTIREEDFNRNPIDRNNIQYNDIELVLNKDEAKELYEIYPTDKYLTFEESWSNFGDYGLLMEYIFFLKENVSLKSRLESQINRLILNESDIDDWLLALTIISYAGRKEVGINGRKLINEINIKDYTRMIHVFNKEYWVKSKDDNVTLQSLHPVRAMLLYDILSEKKINSEEEILLYSIALTDSHPNTLLIDYFYSNVVELNLISKLASLTYTTWETYAGTLESVLWFEVWQYYQENKDIIEEGNLITNNQFSFIMICDVTGCLEINRESLHASLKKINSVLYNQCVEIYNEIEQKTIGYKFVDEFLINTKDKLPISEKLNSDRLVYCGFSIFWFANRISC